MNCESSERHEPEREDADRVRRGDDQAEQRRVPRRAALADEVRGDDRLPVARARARARRPRRAPRRARRGSRAARGASGRRAARSRSRRRGRAPRAPSRSRASAATRARSPARAAPDARRDVERALEHVLRVRAQLVAAARGRRADDDLLPADAVGVVRVAVGERGRAVEPRPRSTTSSRVVRRPPAPGGWASACRSGTSATGRPSTVRCALRGDPARVRVGVDAAGLERRDLGHVEHVDDVERGPETSIAAEVVDREVAERVRRTRRPARAAPPRARGGARAASSRAPSSRRAPTGARSAG